MSHSCTCRLLCNNIIHWAQRSKWGPVMVVRWKINAVNLSAWSALKCTVFLGFFFLTSADIKLTIYFLSYELLLEEAMSESQIAKWTVYFGERWRMNVMVCWPVGEFLNSMLTDSLHFFLLFFFNKSSQLVWTGTFIPIKHLTLW